MCLAKIDPCEASREDRAAFYQSVSQAAMLLVPQRDFPSDSECRRALESAMRKAGCDNPSPERVRQASERMAALVRERFK